MSEAVLTVLKFCFLALLYLFLYRVVRLTLRELRAPALTAEPAVAAPPAPPPRRERRPEPRALLRLRIVEPAPRRGETYTIDREVTVGRGGGCAIVLNDDTYVSQLHARLFQKNGDGYVEDLGSTNGTYVNGKPINGVTRLKRGDRVQFGQTIAEVVK
jgi:pSer/pThr/pTyr-binding forkhead associated (FHA) protein